MRIIGGHIDVAARLRALGYAGASGRRPSPDAVMAFQKVNHIARDGVVGPQTRRALRHPRQPRVPHTRGLRVVVDLSDQVLLVVRDGQVRRIVNAATGNPHLPDGRGQRTPIGTFHVTRKVRGAVHAPLGTLWWPSYFHGGDAVHGEPGSYPYPASHGCVRIPMSEAQAMYGVLQLGTIVQVRR